MDTGAVILLLLFPFVAPIPGPGGIPILITAFGLLAVNHDWADSIVHYIKKHSESVQKVLFPNITWVKWTWDFAALLVLIFGIILNFISPSWFWTGISIGIMAGSTTIFMLNRDRLSKLDKFLRRTGNK